jgi:mRNA interferase MazF
MTRGELWWADFGVPYGSEAGFTRPVLIVQDDTFNKSRIKTIVVLPLTTNLHLLDAPGNVLIRKKESNLINDSVIIASQPYAIDRSWLKEKVAKVPREILEQVETGMKLVLGMGRGV